MMGGMRLLDRYLLRELLVPLAYCLGGFLIFYVAFDLVFHIRSFQEKHLSFADVAAYYVVTLPELLVAQVIPVSLLLALLYVLTNHSRHNELTAMRAAGVSLWRLSMPYVVVGIFLGMLVFAMNELLVPQSNQRAKDIEQRHQPAVNRAPAKVVFDFEIRHWEISGFNSATSEMTDPNIQWDQANGVRRNLSAARGIFTNGQVLLFNVEEWDTKGDAVALHTNYAALALTLPETPEWIRTAIKVAEVNPSEAAKKPQLSIREILEYLRPRPPITAEKRASLMTQLQGRVAEPFTCLAVVLIALPFGAQTGRRNVFAGVASSVFICFAYFIMQRLSMGLGIGGKLPPVLAAWLPNLVFGLTGSVLLWRAR
jgi:lipopolysaccharide export system permease protein